MRLLIAIPCTDYMHFEFVSCLMRLTRHLQNDGINYDVKIKGGTLVYCARDWLAGQAVNNDYTHVLWLDCDMIFPETIVEDLLFCGKEIVTGIYHSRRPPFNSCIFSALEPEITRQEEYPAQAFKIAACGFGCMLMTAQVLKDVFINYHTCFTPERDLGEDIAFCKRATDFGHEIWCEPTVRAGHIGHITVYPEDHERYIAQISNPNNVRM